MPPERRDATLALVGGSCMGAACGYEEHLHVAFFFVFSVSAVQHLCLLLGGVCRYGYVDFTTPLQSVYC